MKAHIITIGDEILIGQIVDTNSGWIAAHLNNMGIRVERKLSIGDDAVEITSAVGTALDSAEVVIITGGLGPTKDDITKKTLAAFFGCGMHEDRQSYELIGSMLGARGIEFNQLNRAQAMVPDDCTVLLNHNGTAPGMWFERQGRILVSLPGVPFEMERLMEDEVLPRLKEHFNLDSIVHRTMITQGIAESVLAETIADWEDALPTELHLAYLPGTSGIRLRLSAYDVDEVKAEQLISDRFGELETIIPRYFIGYGDQSVESAVSQLLTVNGKTLAVAESCTGGEIAARFTRMAGASEYFLAGVVSYSNDAKVNILGVDAGDIARFGAVSSQVATQMAEGVRRVTGSDYAISTTGVAGPTGGSDEKPVGTVWIAVSGPDGTLARKFTLGKLRKQNIERASATAINMLRLVLTGQQDTPVAGGIL